MASPLQSDRVIAFLSVVGVLLLAPAAHAAKGAAIDLGRIEVVQALAPGGAYRLPTIGVRNPGDEQTGYVMIASPVADGERKTPPAEWFQFEPRELTLKPGQTKPVRARIVLPTDADPGDYVALVGAQIATEGDGAQVGAAAAARTTFSVEPASTLQAWWLKLKTFFGDNRPWSWLVPLAFVLALLGWQLAHRFSLRVERRAA